MAKRAAWIICGGVVYMFSMVALGKWLRHLTTVEDVLIATSGVKRRRTDDGWDGR
jgi:hypothetical protein